MILATKSNESERYKLFFHWKDLAEAGTNLADYGLSKIPYMLIQFLKFMVFISVFKG